MDPSIELEEIQSRPVPPKHHAFRDEVVAASPKRVVLKTRRGTRQLSRTTWTIAPIEGETRMMG
jgi:hypothetical protein